MMPSEIVSLSHDSTSPILKHQTISGLTCSECGGPRSRLSKSGLCQRCSCRRNGKVAKRSVSHVSRKRISYYESCEMYAHQHGGISPAVIDAWLGIVPKKVRPRGRIVFVGGSS